MMRRITKFTICLALAVAAASAAGAEAGVPDEALSSPVTYQFSELPAGAQHMDIGGGLRVRGWQLGSGVYFGQSRIADQSTLGFVVERGNTFLGINHRGVQLTKRF